MFVLNIRCTLVGVLHYIRTGNTNIRCTLPKNLRSALHSCTYGNLQCCSPGKNTQYVPEHLARKTEYPVCPICKHPMHLNTVCWNNPARKHRRFNVPIRCTLPVFKTFKFFLLVYKLLEIILVQQRLIKIWNQLPAIS